MRLLNDVMLHLLRCLSPETAHDLAVWAMRQRMFAPGRYETDKTRAIIFGHGIPNPLGLAAGFDKNGYLPEVIQEYGFGYVEVGSITSLGGPGNPKPRMFRIEGNDIMNRMGLNGEPASVVAERLRKAPQDKFAVNIAKTHSPDILGDKAIRDISDSYNLLKGLGLYTVLNISCPNTAEGKTFETPEALRELLSAIKASPSSGSKDEKGCIIIPEGIVGPLLLKLSPTLVPDSDNKWVGSLDKILDIAVDFGVRGFVVCNTWPMTHPKFGKGGASGSKVFNKMIKTVKFIHDYPRTKNMLIIACGGIFMPQHIEMAQLAGADFFQAYNGFVRGPYSGVRFAHDLLSAIDFTQVACAGIQPSEGKT